MLSAAKELNRAELPIKFQKDSVAVTDSLNALHAYAAFHAWVLTSAPYAIPHEANHVLFSCFHKTLLSLHVAHELTLDGLFGSARPHLRQAFESMMIAKLCAVDPQSDIFDRWIDGVDLYFTNGVLKRIKTPDVKNFSEAWSLLCKWSHATVYANQLTLDLDTTKGESEVNFAFIGVLLHFSHHLLNTHILTPSVKYYARQYSTGTRDMEAQARLKDSLSVLREHLGTPSRGLVKDYKATWQLK